LWKVRCPNCRSSAMSWLQMGVVGIVAVPVFFYLVAGF
jgi:hypothetical protein